MPRDATNLYGIGIPCKVVSTSMRGAYSERTYSEYAEGTFYDRLFPCIIYQEDYRTYLSSKLEAPFASP